MIPPQPAGILAGGRALRLGGVDKALLPLGGATLLDHVIARLQGEASGLLLSAGGDAARFARFALPVVPDLARPGVPAAVPGGTGPLAGLLALFEAARLRHPGATHLLTVPCDTPFLPRDLGARLRAAGGRSTIAVAEAGGRRHHVIALWPLALAADLRAALSGEGVRRVEEFAARHAVVPVPFERGEDFLNINTEADRLEAARRIERDAATTGASS